MLSTTRFLRLATMAVALGGFLSGTAAGGSIRYELKELLGQHVYDGTSSWTSLVQRIDTPFGYEWPGIDESRVVIEGRVTTGRAHGDGVTLENTSFNLLPLVTVGGASFQNSISLSPISYYTPEVFRLEQINTDPFRHETIPMPNPMGYPPLSFEVALSIGPAFASFLHGPRRYDPILTGTDVGVGYIVDIPIIATIERAYVILTGPGVTVPEPSGVVVAMGFLLAGVAARWHFRSGLGKPPTSVAG
jgi:hypothetical protein